MVEPKKATTGIEPVDRSDRRGQRWLFDHGAHWTERVGDLLSRPWYRLSRWCYGRWLALREGKP